MSGIQNLGRFGHEQHAGKDNHVRLGGRGLLRELQAVAHKIRQVLNLRLLVIVRQDHGIHLALQPRNLVFEIEVRQRRQRFGLCREDHDFIGCGIRGYRCHYSCCISGKQTALPRNRPFATCGHLG